MTKYTIAVGSPWDGMNLCGLFDSFDDAANVAFHEFNSEEWHITEIEPID